MVKSMYKLADFVAGLYFQNKELLILLGIGGVCGVVAQMFTPGKGFGLGITLLIGIAGFFLGKTFITPFIFFIDDKTIKEIVAGIAASIALSLAINLFRIGMPKHKDKTGWRNNA